MEKREREEYNLKQEEERRGVGQGEGVQEEERRGEGQGEGVQEEESPAEPWMAQPSQETRKNEALQQCLAF